MLFVAAMTAVLVLPARGQVESEPGYIDLGDLESIMQTETTLEVNVKGALLRMVTEAARIEDEALADMLSKLRGVFVRGYSVDYLPSEARDRVASVSGNLEADGWERVVRVRENDEYVEMLMLSDGERIEGMVVFVMETGENSTVFVNIVGEIEPEDISRVGRRFRIRVLEDM
jgi:hypothetical protein